MNRSPDYLWRRYQRTDHNTPAVVTPPPVVIVTSPGLPTAAPTTALTAQAVAVTHGVRIVSMIMC